MVLTSLGSKSGTLFYPIRGNRVNTILKRSQYPAEWTGRAIIRATVAACCTTCFISSCNRLSTPVTERRKFWLGRAYGLGGGVGRGLAVGPDLGVGVGRGVAVADAVAVGLAVGVAVAVGVGVGVPPPTAARISTRPHP